MSVRSTKASIARIATTSVKTNCFRWAVGIAEWASSVRPAAGLVRISNPIRWAGTNSPSSLRSAKSGCVTRLRSAEIHSDTFNLWMRISFVTSRAGAHGHVILCQTDGVLSAAVLSADGFASVAGLVAGVSGRAVRISKTLSAPATLSGWITRSVTACGWTRAFGSVIIGDADCSRTTTDSSAGRRARSNSGGWIGLAFRVVRTLGVRLALIFRNGSASVSVIGVACKSSSADALADVSGCAAVGIRRAGVTGAN